MTDYRRMEWQARANRVAEVIKLICLWAALPPECLIGIYFHFAMWIDAILVFTVLLWVVADFVDRHTRMWRPDLR